MATGVTPNGTSWTSYAITLNGEHIRWGVADTHVNDPALPVLHYCHGSGGGPNQFEGLPAWAGLRNWILDNGWAWIEGTGGSSQNWGGPAARAGYEAQIAHVSTVLDIGDIVILGRSMGGLISYWLATQSNYASNVSGLIVNSGTTDLEYRYATGNTTSRGQIRTAYGAANDAEFAANSIGYDPMLFPLSEWDAKAVLQMYGTADMTVEAVNHAIPWAAKYAASTDYLTWFGFDVRQGGDHSDTNGSYLQLDAMTTFLERARTGSWPTWEPITPEIPEPSLPLRRVLARSRIIAGKRHAVASTPPRAV